jgi:hypothetical protein
LRGSAGSKRGTGGIGCEVSGTVVGAGTDSACILFEQYEYLKLKIILSIDHLIVKLVFCLF